MLANWATIQASTGVRESFWVGHVNNSGEIRSSGSMLLDGTFESLLAITIDATDRRFFQAQAGRMTDAMEPKEILLDPETNRPVIMLDGGAVPVPLDAPNTPGSKPTRTAKGGVGAEELAAQTDAVTRIILTLMGRVGPTALKSGALRRGGFAKEDLSREVLTQWTTFARFIPPTTKTAVITVIGEMIAKRLILSEHPVSGVKKLWLSESGEAKYAELGDGA
jgi:hypothetical protein